MARVQSGDRAVAADLSAHGTELREATDADAVGGVTPGYVATPPDTEAVSALLAAATRHGLGCVARGGGTKIDWGAPPRRCDVLIDTSALTGVDHAAGDLVAQCGPGTSMASFQDTLAAAGQRLSADSPVAGSTVGGLIATGLSGPRRMLHGPIRDLIIGMTTVRADGVAASSGGRVVKNVAGYDLGKLHTGALGTLGVITSVTFRLHPVPPARRVVTAEPGDLTTARAYTREVLRSHVVPAAIEIDWPHDGPLGLQVLVEGAEGGIEARTAEVCALLGGRVSAEPDQGWELLPGAAGDTVLRVAVPLTATAHAAGTLRAAADAAGVPVSVRGSMGAGVLHAALPAAADPRAVSGIIRDTRTAITGGTLTVPHAAATLREELSERGPGLLWGDVPGLGLMRAIKDRLDPDHLLSPGRFVGGI
ncbi:glycolate oxidase FAD binding subunit [Lipingzhangella halophila]|uniref:Glycolate oxidase FAD binding subunit n=1 Tax=Lipingzhangella halophila TaxID=1783352 RepID=A0A7W7RE07_9ACTN|nr:FAD-binding oxidoreductase [Lipingzhangella halophila]MBB4930274.1 glycolate oxidase FAD binding subunit [Lipingzhangella halophila]